MRNRPIRSNNGRCISNWDQVFGFDEISDDPLSAEWILQNGPLIRPSSLDMWLV